MEAEKEIYFIDTETLTEEELQRERFEEVLNVTNNQQEE